MKEIYVSKKEKVVFVYRSIKLGKVRHSRQFEIKEKSIFTHVKPEVIKKIFCWK